MAKTFCETIKAAGYHPGVYDNLNWFNNYLDYTALKKLYSIWLAQYNVTNQLDCDIWQNSSTGNISGVNGNVDTNIILNTSVYKNSTSSTTKNTSSGSSSIKDVQNWLNTNYKTGLTLDGLYGPKTQAALIKALQTELNKQYNAKLTVDGEFTATKQIRLYEASQAEQRAI